MHNLGELEIGVMFWANGEPAETIREVKEFGVRCGQLGIPGEYSIGGNTGKWLESSPHGALRRWRRLFAVIWVKNTPTSQPFCSTVGFVPHGHGRNGWPAQNTSPTSRRN